MADHELWHGETVRHRRSMDNAEARPPTQEGIVGARRRAETDADRYRHCVASRGRSGPPPSDETIAGVWP